MESIATPRPCTVEEAHAGTRTEYTTPQLYTVERTYKLINGLLPFREPDTDTQPVKKLF